MKPIGRLPRLSPQESNKAHLDLLALMPRLFEAASAASRSGLKPKRSSVLLIIVFAAPTSV
jgi:hypothetical protein